MNKGLEGKETQINTKLYLSNFAFMFLYITLYIKQKKQKHKLNIS